MRPAGRAALGLVLAMVTSARFCRAEDAPTTTTLPAAAGPVQQTQVRGTVPDLEGRWLVVAEISVAGGARRTLPSMWEISRENGQLVLHERLVLLPDAQAKALARANDELHVAWKPTPQDLDAIAKAWDTLTPEPRGVVKMTHEIVGRNAFDEVFQKEAVTKDAQWAVRQLYGFEPGQNHPVSQVNVFGATGEAEGVYSGNYIALTIAAAPFPIPIKFEGTFRLLPLSRPTRSIWTRLGDFFAGCAGRKRD